MREVWWVVAAAVAGVVLLAWVFWPDPAAAPAPEPAALEHSIRRHIVLIAVAGIGGTVALVTLTLRAPATAQRVGAWLRLVYNLFIVVVASVLLVAAAAILAHGTSDGSGGAFYLAAGCVVLAVLALDRGTAHRRTWYGILGGNDFWTRMRGLVNETEQLWRELVRGGRKGRGGV